MGGRSGRDVDDLAAQRPHKGRILSLRVNDDNVGVTGKHLIDDLALGGKGLTTARNAENKLVAIQELPTVCDNHILGDDILTVVNAVGMANVLHPERNKDRKALRGQCAERLDLADTEGHRRIQSVKLLELENTELAKVLSRCGKQSFCVIVKLLLGVRRVNHRQNGKHHSLVTGRQVVKELFHFLALLFNVVGKLSRIIVVGILPTLPVGRIGFHAEQTAFRFPHGFIRGYGDNINGHHQIAVEIGHFCNHTVLDIRSVLPQEQHSAVTLSDLEIVARELHRIRADEILEVVTLSAGFLDVEAELRFFTGTVKVVENAEPFIRLQLHALTAESPEVGDQVSSHTGKVVSRFLHTLLAYRNGDVLLLNDSVCAGRFIKEHPIVLLTVLVKSIALQGEKNGFLKVCTVQTAVVNGDLGGCAAVKAVEQLRIFKEHSFLILTTGDSIVDVAELIGLGELISAHLKNTVVVNRLDGDHILNTPRHNKSFFILLEQVAKRFNHWLLIPPSACVPFPASSSRSRCW